MSKVEDEQQISIEWLPITVPAGFAYEVSPSTGNVRNAKTKRVLSANLVTGGYRKVTLSAKGRKPVTAYNRIIVLENCVGPLPEKVRIGHLDGRVDHDALRNLVWAAPGEPFLIRNDIRTTDGRIDREVRPDLFGRMVTVQRYGRLKASAVCSKGHPLSMDGKADANTAVWGFGNRICLRCNEFDELLFDRPGERIASYRW